MWPACSRKFTIATPASGGSVTQGPRAGTERISGSLTRRDALAERQQAPGRDAPGRGESDRTQSAVTAPTELPEPTLDVSIVVPYYNPGDRLRATVAHMVRVLDASGMTFEIIAVSDGSTDGSPFTLEGFPDDTVRRVSFDANVGKGHALRVGLGMGRGRYLGFIDADGDISPELLAPFVAIMQTQQPDIIIGSKRDPESVVHYPPLRRLYSWGYQLLIHLLFRLKVADTQVGIKLVDRRVIADVLPMLRETRFALDLELLVLARRLGYTSIVEAPVRIEKRFNSTISPAAVWGLLVDTLRFFVRYSVQHRYDAALDAARGAERGGSPTGEMPGPSAGGHGPT